MKSLEYPIYNVILWIINIFSFIIQFYVLYVVKFKSPKEMSELKYFLNAFTFFDMTLTFIIGTGLAPIMAHDLFGSYLTGWAKYLSPNGQLVVMVLSMYSISMALVCQYHCLFHRLIMLSNPRIRNFFMHWPIKIGVLVYFNLAAICISVLSYFAAYDEDTFQVRIKEERPQLSTEFFIWFDLKNPYTIYFLVASMGGFLAGESFCLILVYFILKILNRKTGDLSSLTIKYIRQFIVLISAQLILPVFFIVLPITMGVIAMLNGLVIREFYAQIGYIAISSYGPINGLFTIFFISPYRRYFFNQLKALKRLFSSNTSVDPMPFFIPNRVF